MRVQSQADSQLVQTRETALRHLNNYSSYKASIFSWFYYGHHHAKRAAAVKAAIQSANSIEQITEILKGQKDIFEGEEGNNDSALLDTRWSMRANLKNTKRGGFYEAICAALNEIKPFPLTKLPEDVATKLGRYFAPQSQASLAATGRAVGGLFQPTLDAEKLNNLILQILHGCESKVREWLDSTPSWLSKGSATDLSRREFTLENHRALTPIEAAIVAGDIAPNAASTGIFELLVDKLQQQHPEDWHTILHDQTLEIYTKSLKVYATRQEEKICALEERREAGEAIDDAVMTAARQRRQAYQAALDSGDLNTIINAHTNPDSDPTTAPDAQKDHVIQVDQALLDAIAGASDAEIQAVLDDPALDSPLSNLIKAFRKDVDTICRSEIINNPQHLIKLFTLYESFYNRVEGTDPNYKKCQLFWCHLVGYGQRYLSACDAQVFANPGLWEIVECNLKNQRSFNFRYGSGAILPLVAASGLGYQFAACGGAGSELGLAVRGRGRCGMLWGANFTKLISSKNRKLSEILLHSCCNRSPTLNFAV